MHETERSAKRVSTAWLLVFAVIWWVLTHPDSGVLWMGVIAVATGVLLHLGLGGRGRHRLTLRGALVFAPYFIGQSVRGGVDVARRAFSPGPPLSPTFVDYPLSLPEGPARVFFVNCISLLPGTFSARVDRSRIRVHLLAEDAEGTGRIRQLEKRVGALFGLEEGG